MPLHTAKLYNALEALCDYALYKSTFTFTLHYSRTVLSCPSVSVQE